MSGRSFETLAKICLFWNFMPWFGKKAGAVSVWLMEKNQREERMRTTLERDSLSSRNSETERSSACT